MEFFRIHKDIPFMSHALVFNVISLLTFLLAVFFLATRGLHFSVEFTGGTLVEVAYAEAPDVEKVREQLTRDGFADVQVQNFGTSRDVLIRLPLQKDLDSRTRQREGHRLAEGGGRRTAATARVEFVGPQVGKELATDGAMALLMVVIGIVLYLAFRFEWRFAVSGDHRQPARRGDHSRLLRLLPVGVLAAGAGGRAGGARLLGERVGGRVRPGARDLQEEARPDHAGGDQPRHHQHDLAHHHHPRLYRR